MGDESYTPRTSQHTTQTHRMRMIDTNMPSHDAIILLILSAAIRITEVKQRHSSLRYSTIIQPRTLGISNQLHQLVPHTNTSSSFHKQVHTPYHTVRYLQSRHPKIGVGLGIVRICPAIKQKGSYLSYQKQSFLHLSGVT